jgi:alpha-tubulin suppressor-like RCC1 family protein
VVSGGYRDIAAGYRHTCGVLDSGSVQCWGVNDEGQLGTGADTVDRETTPVSVSSIRSAVAIDSHYNHTCVLTTSGAVYCWGANDEGQLGVGSTGGFNSTPQQVSGLSNATSVGVGKLHTCAVAGGGGSCWGKGSVGRLGTGQSMSGTFPTPQSVANLNGMLRVESGVRHSCALTSDGSVWCWGARGQGRLGDGQLLGSTSTPVQVSDLDDATHLTVGSVHGCAVVQSGDVRCWGDGGGGRLGYGGTSLKVVPVDVAMPSGVTAVEVAAGSRVTCMRTAGDSVYCWGEVLTQQNGYQSFGDTPSKMNVSGTPVALGAGRDHVCAMFDDGSARCWGNNSQGQLGDATTDDSLSPVQVQ